jgi:hypothetical protein
MKLYLTNVNKKNLLRILFREHVGLGSGLSCSGVRCKGN